MPLSEHEQRLLEQMERALYAEDPKLATTLRGGAGRFARGQLIAGVLGTLAGIAVVVVGVASKMPIISVVGFLVALVGVWFVVRSFSTTPAADGAAVAPTKKKGGQAGLLSKAEERFQRRRDQNRGDE